MPCQSVLIMLDHQVLDLVSLISFTLGALAFSVLVLMYFRQRQSGSRVLAAFTAVCAAAFITNLALRIVSVQMIDSPVVALLALALGLTTSLLPPLVFHLVYAKEAGALPRPLIWRFLLLALYLASAAAALLKGLDDANFVVTEWMSSAPAVSFGIAALLALAAQSVSSRTGSRNQRRWNQALLTLMALSAALNLLLSSPWLSLLPDYLLLAFFCVTLYYEERLMFFDLLIKRGAFFAAALLGLPPILMLGFRLTGSPVDWYRCWLCALALAPFWLIAPWAYHGIAGAIDRGWLRRRFSFPEAEQRFIRNIQIASTEEDLRERAVAGLREIFQAPATVSFDQEPMANIEARPDGMPFLSDDHRLLQSLSRTLGVVLENVRFRERATSGVAGEPRGVEGAARADESAFLI